MTKAKIISDGVAVTSFLDLTDTPNTYTADAGLKVNSGGTALEYGGQQPRMYVTGSAPELNTTIPVTLGAFTVWKTMVRLDLPVPLVTGDRLVAFAELELRNDNTINSEVATSFFIAQTASPNDGDDLPSGGYFLNPITGHNVDNVTHYYNTPEFGSIIMPVDMATPRIYLRGRCRSSVATGAETFTIMQPGYHKITCLVYPKNGL